MSARPLSPAEAEVVARFDAAEPAPESWWPLRWTWDMDARHMFRRCLDCGAEVWAFKEGLLCSDCDRFDEGDGTADGAR